METRLAAVLASEMPGISVVEVCAELGISTSPFPEAERSPVVAISVEDPETVRTRLADAGVVVALRADSVRFAFHVFNNDSDVDRALEALA